MTDEPAITAAKWLLVGFYKNWYFGMVMCELHKRGVDWQDHKFFPTSGLWAKSPVRAFIAQEYPALFKFLDSNSPEKGLTAVGEITKLRAKVVMSPGAINRKERDEIYYTNKKARAEAQSYRASRKAFTSRWDWSVTK